MDPFLPKDISQQCHQLPLQTAVDDISWVFHIKKFYSYFMETLLHSDVFADSPWWCLYPLYDQLIPSKYSKFILTIRDSTRDWVNSHMKMLARQYVEDNHLMPKQVERTLTMWLY